MSSTTRVLGLSRIPGDVLWGLHRRNSDYRYLRSSSERNCTTVTRFRFVIRIVIDFKYFVKCFEHEFAYTAEISENWHNPSKEYRGVAASKSSLISLAHLSKICYILRNRFQISFEKG